MSKNDSKAKKALIQIPREIRKLTKIIAIIGETLMDAKIRKIKGKQEEFEYWDIEQEEKKGRKSVVPNQKNTENTKKTAL